MGGGAIFLYIAFVQAPLKNQDIPYFKEIVLMSFACNECGFKSNEIKCGGAMSPKGRRITLKVTMPEDLARDILKVIP